MSHREDKVKAALPSYSVGYDHWRTVWENTLSPKGRRYSPSLVEDDLKEMARKDPQVLRQAITASGSTKISYATSGS